MTLHVTFTNGANPWVSLPTDRHTVAKLWRRWMKNHPDTARPRVFSGDWEVYPDPYGRGYALHNWPNAYERIYKRLGNALAALERMSNR